jgi:hypothetical protein
MTGYGFLEPREGGVRAGWFDWWDWIGLDWIGTETGLELGRGRRAHVKGRLIT